MHPKGVCGRDPAGVLTTLLQTTSWIWGGSGREEREGNGGKWEKEGEKQGRKRERAPLAVSPQIPSKAKSYINPWPPHCRFTVTSTYPTKCDCIMPWLQLQFDYDPTTIRLRRIARAYFQFDASKKWTCQFFVVVVVSSSYRRRIAIVI